MNGIEKITARIEAEAVADAARTAEEAKARCAEVRAEGEANAQERYWRRMQEGVKLAEDRAERLAKAADMEARKSVLSCRRAIVEEAFERAEVRLRTLGSDDYIDFLSGQAVRAAVSGREQLILSEEDRAVLGEKVVKRANAKLAAAGRVGKLTLAPAAGSFQGGLLLRDGNITVNCTLDALMGQAREEQTTAVAAELFS